MDALNQRLLEVPVFGVWVRNAESSNREYFSLETTDAETFHMVLDIWFLTCGQIVLTLWKHVDYSNFPMLLASTVCYLTLVCDYSL